MRRFDILDDWRLKQRDPGRSVEEDGANELGWISATVPGLVQTDLLSHGLIPDPYAGMNEVDVSWIGECDWLYRCRFNWDAPEPEWGETALCFGGLDTIATVWLNGHEILNSDNMFVAHRVVVRDELISGENELTILFESALRVGREREAAFGKMPVWNGDSSRVYIRKAQYHYGWDWGPCLLTTGPWRPIWLEQTTARIIDLQTQIELADDLAHARIGVQFAVEHLEHMPQARIGLTLYDPDDVVSAQITLDSGQASLQHVFEIDQPSLWWPHGMGPQSLYRLVVSLFRQGETAAAEVIEQQEFRLGVRRIALVQEEISGEAGTTFRFEVNGIAIFCGGANWIPADMLLTRVTRERCRAYLQRAVDAHMLMIRVWGGGIYESDDFYDLCDELGLLVWQDFAFACGLYPAHESFLQSVRAEAECAIRRLRHHPSLALWCGNNEDYDVAGQQGRVIDGPLASSFPARIIYEQLLPELCARLDPGRRYWPGSPYGGRDSNDPRTGDRHVWDIWHRDMAPYQEYGRFGGRFVSEFGMAALPGSAAIDHMAPPEERYPWSQTLRFHFKAEQGVRRLSTYLSRDIPVPAEMAAYAWATQLLQAEALSCAIADWRRLFRGPGHYASGGALVWQLNDCWPAVSWSIIDDELVPKMAYYAVRRALADVALSIARRSRDTCELWAVNGTSAVIDGAMLVREWSLSGRIQSEEEYSVQLAPRSATLCGATRLDEDSGYVMQARLLHGGAGVACAALWPEPLSGLPLHDPRLRLDTHVPGEVLVHTQAPAKSVWLENGSVVKWSDNGFDVFPGEPYAVRGPDTRFGQVQVRSLFDLRAHSRAVGD